MAKKLSFRPDFGPKNFFCGFYLFWMLENAANYHCMLFQGGKKMNQTWENGKKPSFRSDFGPFWPKVGPKKLFS